jgi:hypothetical protein
VSKILIHLDRLQALAEASGRTGTPHILGFRVVRDNYIRQQTTQKAYARVREYLNPLTGTRLFVQYQPQLPGLPAFKITIIGVDERNLSLREVRQVMLAFPHYRLLLVEVAFDFRPESKIDLEFVRRHALFGKSHPNFSRMFPTSARYGGRKSHKLVRSYWKEKLNSFRIELELHSSWLRQNNIARLEDLRKLAGSLFPNHIRFVHVDWRRVRRYLSRRGLRVAQIILEAKGRSGSIHDVLAYLRSGAGVTNVHRFLVTGDANDEIQRSLKKWSQRL